MKGLLMNNQAPNQVIEQANQLIKAGQRENAYRMLQELVFNYPDETKAWWLIANLTSDMQEKRYALEQVLRIRPDFEKAREQLAKLPSNQNIPPQPIQSPMIFYPPPTQQSNNNRSLIILGILLIFICSGVSFFAGTQINQQSSNTKIEILDNINSQNDESSSLSSNTTSNTNQNNETTIINEYHNSDNPVFNALQGEWKRQSIASVFVVDDSDKSMIFFNDGSVVMNNITGNYRFIDASTIRIDFPTLASPQVREMSPVVNIIIMGDELEISTVNGDRNSLYIRPWVVDEADSVLDVVPSGDGMFVTSDGVAIPVYIVNDGQLYNSLDYLPYSMDSRPAIILTGSVYNLSSEIAFWHYTFGLGIRTSLNGDINIVESIFNDSIADEYGLQLYDGIISVDGVSMIGVSGNDLTDYLVGVKGTIVEIGIMRGNDALSLSIPREFARDGSAIYYYESIIKPGGLLYIVPDEVLKSGHYCIRAVPQLSARHSGCFTIP